MNVEHLVKMANQIGQFYEALPNREEGLKGTAMHIRRSWDPRMRRALLEEMDQGGADEMLDFVREAIDMYRKELTPPVSA